MSDPVNEPRWSVSQWCWCVGGVFLLQLVFVFLFSDRSIVAPRTTENQSTFGLVTAPALTWQLNQVVSADDPTLFALANVKGFAGPAWLLPPVIDRPLNDWTDDERWLLPPEEKFGAAFNSYVRKIGSVHDQAPDKPVPMLAAVTVENPPITFESQLQLGGDIRTRLLSTPLKLPLWPNVEMLYRTVVEVAVNAEGGIVSATLLATNGLPTADKAALELVRGARFEPLKETGNKTSSELTWGQMIFQWRPTAPVKLNPGEANP